MLPLPGFLVIVLILEMFKIHESFKHRLVL